MAGEPSDRALRLSDGRRLGYAEYGDPSGVPVLIFHGNGGSRLQYIPEIERPPRYICPERPGFGLSDFQRGRTLLDWPADMAELLASLQLDRVAVVGVSAGGPYALACAFALKEVYACALVGGALHPDAPVISDELRPQNRRIERLLRVAPWLLRLQFARYARLARRSPARFEAKMRDLTAQMGASDRDFLSHPDVWSAVVREEVEGLRAGGRGGWWDAVILSRPFGFDLEDIRKPVFVWNGSDDRQSPPTAAAYVAHRIPNAELTIIEGGGHTAAYRRWHDVIAALTASH